MLEGFAPFGGGQTWYRVEGDLRSGRTPLIVVHGGPGLTHDYLSAFAALADERAIVLYDQLGNGRSTHYPDRGPEFWTIDLLVDELANLLAHLAVDRYALLGQSFGGAVAMQHAVAQPSKLRALILANTFADQQAFLAGAMRLRSQLPAAVQEALSANERAGTLDSPAYQAATMEFTKRHLCRLDEWPAELLRSIQAFIDDPTVFTSMYGRSLFLLEGSLRNWSIVDRLGAICVPTLAYRGAFDEVVPECMETIMASIPAAEGHTFPESSHLPHLEEPEACLSLVRAFLRRFD